jgi:hypothetical protein
MCGFYQYWLVNKLLLRFLTSLPMTINNLIFLREGDSWRLCSQLSPSLKTREQTIYQSFRAKRRI